MAFYTMIPIHLGVVRDIRNKINRKITQLSLGFFSEEHGAISLPISGDVNEIENSIMSSLDMLFKNPDSDFGLSDWHDRHQLAADFVRIGTASFGRISYGAGRQKLKRKSFEGQQLLGTVDESGGRDVGWTSHHQGFQCRKKIQQRFEKSNEQFRRLTNRIYRRQQMAHPMSEFLSTVTIVIVLWYGWHLDFGQQQSDRCSDLHLLFGHLLQHHQSREGSQQVDLFHSERLGLCSSVWIRFSWLSRISLTRESETNLFAEGDQLSGCLVQISERVCTERNRSGHSKRKDSRYCRSERIGKEYTGRSVASFL